MTCGQVTRYRDLTLLKWAVRGVHFQVPQLPGQEENDCVPGTGLHPPRRRGRCSHTSPQTQSDVLEIVTEDVRSWGLLREQPTRVVLHFLCPPALDWPEL